MSLQTRLEALATRIQQVLNLKAPLAAPALTGAATLDGKAIVKDDDDRLVEFIVGTKPATDAPNTYPIGVSQMSSGDDPSWPEDYMNITTIRLSGNRITQFANGPYQASPLYWRAEVSGTWQPWKELVSDDDERLGYAEDLPSIIPSVKAVAIGGGTVSYSLTYVLKWTSRFIIISQGNGPHFGITGFFNIDFPPEGTVIPGVAGVPDLTVTSEGIPLYGWSALYYVLPIGGSSTGLPGNFRVSGYTGSYEVPAHWILVAIRLSDDPATLTMCNGLKLVPGTSASEDNPIPRYDLKPYIQSRGMNLISNGSAFLKNNQNFSGAYFEGSQAPSGAGGSFVRTAQSSSLTTDESIPVDPSKTYTFTFSAKQLTPGNVARIYGMFMCYDVDGNNIHPLNYYRPYGSVTTLAADLNPGDTTITLTDASTWYDGGTAHARTIGFYDYTNSRGYTYPPGTYTRNNIYDGTNGAWPVGGIEGNVITLTTPYAGALRPAGTSVGNLSSGGTYEYLAAVNAVVPETWTTYTGEAGGTRYEASADGQESQFRPGTASIKVGWLINRDDVSGGGSKHAFGNISFSEVNARNIRKATDARYIQKVSASGYLADFNAAPSWEGPVYSGSGTLNGPAGLTSGSGFQHFRATSPVSGASLIIQDTINGRIWIRHHTGSVWGSWNELSTGGHSHSALDITGGELPSQRITSARQGENFAANGNMIDMDSTGTPAGWVLNGIGTKSVLSTGNHKWLVGTTTTSTAALYLAGIGVYDVLVSPGQKYYIEATVSGDAARNWQAGIYLYSNSGGYLTGVYGEETLVGQAGGHGIRSGSVITIPDDPTIYSARIALRMNDLNATYYFRNVSMTRVFDSNRIDSSLKDGLAATPSMRTLGTGSTQAAPGDDARFTSRVLSDRTSRSAVGANIIRNGDFTDRVAGIPLGFYYDPAVFTADTSVLTPKAYFRLVSKVSSDFSSVYTSFGQDLASDPGLIPVNPSESFRLDVGVGSAAPGGNEWRFEMRLYDRSGNYLSSVYSATFLSGDINLAVPTRSSAVLDTPPRPTSSGTTQVSYARFGVQLKSPASDLLWYLDHLSVVKSDRALNEKVGHGSALLSTNTFGGTRVYISPIDNAIFNAHLRYQVTGTLYLSSDDSVVSTLSQETLAKFFNGNYESAVDIGVGQYVKLSVVFNGGNFPSYPYGDFYVSHYFDNYSESMEIRVYNNYAPQGLGWRSLAVTDFVNQPNAYIRKAENTYYQISEVEFTFRAPTTGSKITKIGGIDWSLYRPSTTANERPMVDKYAPQNLYHNFTWKDAGETTAKIYSDGRGEFKTSVTLDGTPLSAEGHSHTADEVTDLEAAIEAADNFTVFPAIDNGSQVEVNPSRTPPSGNGFWDLRWDTVGKFMWHLAASEALDTNSTGPIGIGVRGGVGVLMDNKGFGGTGLRINMQGEYDDGPAPITGTTRTEAEMGTSRAISLTMGSRYGTALEVFGTKNDHGILFNFAGFATTSDSSIIGRWQAKGGESLRWYGDGTFRCYKDFRAWGSGGTVSKIVAANTGTDIADLSQVQLDGSIPSVTIYRRGGASVFYAARMHTPGIRTWALDLSHAAAAMGSETYTRAIEVVTDSSTTVKIALFGGVAKVQPSRAGQLTDSSGGTSGGNTVAAVTDTPTAANAIATLAAKINAIEDKLSAAGTGIGVTK